MFIGYLWPSLILFSAAYGQTSDKYADEDRPYKFGFNIQGYQHRQEEKGERGIIKGEYGFITADGYYRVTVYATDENGDFKILSMKNYYVGFPPEDPTTTPETLTQRLDVDKTRISNPSLNNPPAVQKVLKQRPLVKPLGLMACSDCRVPVPPNQQDIDPVREQFGGINFGSGGIKETDTNLFRPNQNEINQQGIPVYGGFLNSPNQAPDKQKVQGFQELFQLESNNTKNTGSTSPGDAIIPSGLFGNLQIPNQINYENDRDLNNRQKFLPEDPKKIQNDILDEEPKKRVEIGKITNGLPPGITVEDIKNLFYKFNYTTGFHGHHEYGYRNGDKEGDYFFDGRDGVERQVKYQANEFGYQPNITFLELLENDDRRPREETEKDYGLKGYEFKWFYGR